MNKTILVIDNYDSFSHNLARYVRLAGMRVNIVRNDQIDCNAVIRRRDLDGIVISPGPCTPQEAGQCIPLIQRAAGHLPILGVCLGHQAISEAFGGATLRAPQPVHGRTSPINFNESESLFKGLEQDFEAARYHSLISDIRDSAELKAIAHTNDTDKILMGIKHKKHPIFGIQFHPESILTCCGQRILDNFCALL